MIAFRYYIDKFSVRTYSNYAINQKKSDMDALDQTPKQKAAARISRAV
jgi:cytochrome c biogenesis protein ResB